MQKAKRNILLAGVGASLMFGAVGSALSIEGESDGNRYFLERYYDRDISAAKAFLDAVVKKGKWTKKKGRWTRKSNALLIVDVRDATEYSKGHPEGAMHVPYPRIYRECENDNRSEDGGSCIDGVVATVAQDPVDFFLEVEARIRDKSTPIATLCRTGFRSVLAGNILANPEAILGPDYAGRGYENVSNIWEGFVGQPKPGIVSTGGDRYVVGDKQVLQDLDLPDGSSAKGFIAYDLDLDNNELIDAEDKDGWRYYQGLPYDTRLHWRLISAPVDADGYYDAP